jgi:hypothetical protein
MTTKTAIVPTASNPTIAPNPSILELDVPSVGVAVAVIGGPVDVDVGVGEGVDDGVGVTGDVSVAVGVDVAVGVGVGVPVCVAVDCATTATPILPTAFESAGFDTYAGCAFPVPFTVVRGWNQTHRVHGDVRAERVLDEYRDWRAGRTSTFAYLHTGDLHAPLDPPGQYVDSWDVDLDLSELRSIERYLTDSDEGDPSCRHYRDQKLRLYRAMLSYVSA